MFTYACVYKCNPMPMYVVKLDYFERKISPPQIIVIFVKT